MHDCKPVRARADYYRAGTLDSWLSFPCSRPDADALLVCFPYAGGSALTFRPWARLISPRIEVAIVQLPGRDQRLHESFAGDVDQIVREVGVALCEQADRPLALFGHSVGSILAFETARWLEARRRRLPQHLILAGRSAVHLPRTEPVLHLLDDRELLAKLRQLNGTPPLLLDSPEMIEFFLPRLRADLRLDDLYVFCGGSRVACPVTVMGGSEDADASRDALLAWRELSGGEFQCRMFPGGHFFVHTAELGVIAAVETIVHSLLGC